MNQQPLTSPWTQPQTEDLARATKFYEKVFGLKLTMMEMPGMVAAMFPMVHGSGKVNGCLAKSAMHKPAKSGCVVYMNANPDLKASLGRVAKAGGTVVSLQGRHCRQRLIQ